jgi:recombination protein RecT
MTDPAPKANAVTVIANTLRERDMQAAIRVNLPKDVDQDKFTSATIEALRRAPQVFEDCDRTSVYNAIVEAARDGLIPDGKQGALVPFNTKVGEKYIKKCQWMIMPSGIVDKLAKQGVTVYAASVYDGDQIEVWNDDAGQHVKHEVNAFGERGPRIGAYACARTAKGVTYVETMNLTQLAAVAKVSKSKTKDGIPYGPWIDWPDRMSEKSCLHRIVKRIPNVTIAEDDEFKETSDRPAITIAAVPQERSPDQDRPPERPKALQAVVDQTTGEITQGEGSEPF